jgi:hypothetical protein
MCSGFTAGTLANVRVKVTNFLTCAGTYAKKPINTPIIIINFQPSKKELRA